MQDSIYTKIIKGELPCHKVYEDDRVIAILDIDPLTPGHTLVIPKTQIDHIWDLTDDDYQYLMGIAKQFGEHIRKILDAPRVGMAVDGYGVPHVHVHLFPLSKGLEHTITEHVARPKTEPDHQALADMAERLRWATE